MNDNVFCLDVSVDDVSVVEVIEGAANLANNSSDFGLGKRSRFSHFLIEISRFTQFHHKVNGFISAESAIKPDNVGMIKFHVDLDLSNEGLFINLIRNCGFEDLFESIKRASCLVLCNINRAKGAFTTEVENVEIINGQILSGVFFTI
jgi:hypothetical protein